MRKNSFLLKHELPAFKRFSIYLFKKIFNGIFFLLISCLQGRISSVNCSTTSYCFLSMSFAGSRPKFQDSTDNKLQHIWIPEHSIALQSGKNCISIHCFPNHTHLISMFKNFSSIFKVLTMVVVFQIPGIYLFLISLKNFFLFTLMFFLDCILV